MKKIFDIVLLLLGLDCKARREAADDGACNYGGQGKDRYGK